VFYHLSTVHKYQTIKQLKLEGTAHTFATLHWIGTVSLPASSRCVRV